MLESDLDMMIDDVATALRPYGFVPGDCARCALVLRLIADRLDQCDAGKCQGAAIGLPAGRRERVH